MRATKDRAGNAVVLILALSLTSAAWASTSSALPDTQVVVYPESSQFWTGKVQWCEYPPGAVYKHDNLSGYGRYNDHGSYWRVLGWMKFDLSQVPDTAAITSVEAHYYQISYYGDMAHRVALLLVDPVEAAGEEIRDSVGTELSPYRTDTVSYGWIERQLDAAGIAAVESCLAQDWIALAFVGRYEDEGSGEFYGYASGTWRPYLTITYDPSGAVQEERPRNPKPTFALFPNPTTRRSSISYSLPTQAGAELSVLDVSGREVWTKRLVGERTGAIQLPLLPAGVYLVRLQSASFTAAEKLVVQR